MTFLAVRALARRSFSLCTLRTARIVCAPKFPTLRFYSAEAPKPVDPKISAITDEIAKLSLLEVADLVEDLKTRLNISEVAAMPMGMPMAGAGAAAQETAEPVEEKTEFNVKLEKFDASSKIKIIKEVRNILPDLKLAEAKKLVESAPAILKTDVPKEEAEKIKEALKAVGGEVALE